MKKTNSIFLGILLISTISQAGTGWIDTERFGYTGTITRYSDSALTNQVSVVQTGPRDGAIWSDSDSPAAYVSGSWWYSTAVDEYGNPLGSGWGNTTGNTGTGFIQFWDEIQNYVTSQEYSFSNFDGTYWTDFNVSLSVAMPADDEATYSRLSTTPSSTGDSGYFQSLNVNLIATGLQGVESTGWIVAEEADTYATGVTGTISGVFVNTSSTTANNGYYVFEFALNMDNWAYENRVDLVGEYDTFYVGSFGAPVPEPATMVLLGLGGLLLRKRK